VHVALHMDLNWDVGRIALASAVNLNHSQVRVFSNHVGVTTIERLDQGHLYPLGERRTNNGHGRGANLRPPAPQADALLVPKELSRQFISWLFGTSTWPEAGAAFGPLQYSTLGGPSDNNVHTDQPVLA
jgi:hypothetical protein